MTNVWRVGFPDHDVDTSQTLEQSLVGLLNVEHESAIVITPDGDVELFTSDGIDKNRLLQAQNVKDTLTLHLNYSS